MVCVLVAVPIPFQRIPLHVSDIPSGPLLCTFSVVCPSVLPQLAVASMCILLHTTVPLSYVPGILLSVVPFFVFDYP